VLRAIGATYVAVLDEHIARPVSEPLRWDTPWRETQRLNYAGCRNLSCLTPHLVEHTVAIIEPQSRTIQVYHVIQLVWIVAVVVSEPVLWKTVPMTVQQLVLTTVQLARSQCGCSTIASVVVE
jgi:hypothetical protein